MKPDTVAEFVQAMSEDGWTLVYASESQALKRGVVRDGHTVYLQKRGEQLRVSDHHLPVVAGRGTHMGHEVIVSWSKPLAAIVAQVNRYAKDMWDD